MATVSNRATFVLGPLKCEVLNLTDVSDEDTVDTLIQNPEWAVGVNNTDTEDTSAALNVALTDNSKTLTINNANLTGSSEVNILVFGY